MISGFIGKDYMNITISNNVADSPKNDPHQVSLFSDFPPEIREKILSYLEIQDLIRFESTCKLLYEGVLTSRSWKKITQLEGFYSKNDTMLSPKHYREIVKSMNCTFKYIYNFQAEIRGSNPIANALTISDRFIQSNSLLQVYRERDLAQKLVPISSHTKKMLKTCGKIPEYLFRTLFAIQDYRFDPIRALPIIVENSHKAIQEKASLIAIIILNQLNNETKLDDKIVQIFIEAAYADNTDAIQMYLANLNKTLSRTKQIKYIHSLCERFGRLPYFLAALAKLENLEKKKEELLTEAVDYYQNSSPVPLYIAYAYAKIKKDLKKWQEADDVYGRIQNVGHRLPAEALENYAFVKLQLKQFDRAQKLCEELINQCGQHVPIVYLELNAEIQYIQKKWQLAYESYKRILNYSALVNIEVSYSTIEKMAHVCMLIKQYEQAKTLYAAIINQGSYSIETLENALHVNMMLGDWKEADPLCQKLLKVTLKGKELTEVLRKFALIKRSLGELEEADKYFEWHISSSSKISPHACVYSALIKIKLGKLQEAESLLDDASKAFRGNNRDLLALEECLKHLSSIKFKLEKKVEGKAICKELEAIYLEIIQNEGVNTSAVILKNAGYNKLLLGKIKESIEWYVKAKSAPDYVPFESENSLFKLRLCLPIENIVNMNEYIKTGFLNIAESLMSLASRK